MDELQRKAEEALAMLEPNQSRPRLLSSQQPSGSSNSNSRERSAIESVPSAQVVNSNPAQSRSTPHGSTPVVSRVSWRNLPTRVGGRIPVHRLASDARELTAEEMARFHNLIPTSRSSMRHVPGTNPSSVSINWGLSFYVYLFNLFKKINIFF